MTEGLGLSWLGALFLLALAVPNLLWTRRKPRGYATSREDRRLTLLERAGWMLPGAAALGVGHIGIHLEYRKEALR